MAPRYVTPLFQPTTTGMKGHTMPRTPEESAEATANSGAADASVPTPTEGQPAQAAAAAGGDRPRIVLTLDEQAVKDLGDERITPGMTMARKDYCVRRWTQGAGRGTIAKELTRLQGKPVQYQIVFQAVKGIPQGNSGNAAPTAGAPTAPPPITAPPAPPAPVESAPQSESQPAE